MTRRLFALALMPALVVIPTGPLFAWNKAGHMVTGAIAFQEWKTSSPVALARVAAILKTHSDSGKWENRMDGMVLPADDAAEAKLVAERRGILAGYRLADLLAKAVGPDAPVAAGAESSDELFVACWNVENLFDTEDDPAVEGDEEFTPSGAKQWTAERFQIKLANLARVIGTMKEGKGPDILGLCEVENRKAVESLVAKLEPLGRHYKVVHQDSPSDRGIDCALLYDAAVLELKDATFHRVDVDLDKTRDIVEVRFGRGGDVLTVFVNHWPSRGNVEAERIKAAGILRTRLDEILGADGAADIVILGDLNDEPADTSVKTTLKTTGSPVGLPPGVFFNSMSPFHGNPDRGTMVFGNKWQVFDHVIVSPGLLDNNRFRWKAGSTSPLILLEAQLFDPPGAGRIPLPNRSFSGNNFHPDGFSDHLPVGCLIRR